MNSIKKGKKVSGFIQKLFSLINDKSNDEIISWGESCNQFVIRNVGQFTNKVVPAVFKHQNYSSFIRQLNIYGFNKSKHEENAYEHAHLDRNCPNSLRLIKRKSNKKKLVHQKQEVQNQDQVDIKIRFNELKSHFHQLKIQNKKLKEDKKLLKKSVSQFKSTFFDLMKRIVLSLYIQINQISESKGETNIEETPVEDFENEEIDEILNFLWENKIYDYESIKKNMEILLKKGKDESVMESQKIDMEKLQCYNESSPQIINIYDAKQNDIAKYFN